jgi:hypothetical protein
LQLAEFAVATPGNCFAACSDSDGNGEALQEICCPNIYLPSQIGVEKVL